LNLFYQPNIAEGVLVLDAEESRHCTKVLRKKVGENIFITDGKGFFYDAVIRKDSEKECQFEITQTTAAPERNFSVHIAVSPTKNTERIEWFVEKAVELGVDRISLLDCDHTERTYVKIERLRKVAISAMKQSLKATLPALTDVIAFDKFLPTVGTAQRFIAYVDASNRLHLQTAAKSKGSYCVLIGPEGDFSQTELDHALTAGFQKVSLGQSRLRTETAGLAACHILNLVNEIR
jgi:16S rRNA (uracil1498-N3)-methyltransferase